MAGCGSEKPAPSIGDNTNMKPDSSIPPDPVSDGGANETNTPVDTGTNPTPPGLCTDAGNCAVILTAATPTIPADGKSQDVITASIDARLTGTIEFTISGPGLWDNGRNSIMVPVDASGKARANFVSDAGGGIATITARVVGRDSAAQITIEMPALADITYSTQHNLMGVKSSGFNESNQITFKILAPNGVPYPPGLVVNFEHKPLSGSTIGTQKSCTILDCIVKDTGTTDEKGQVQLSLASGTLQGTAIVSITATAGGQTKRVDVSSPIVGAKVSGGNVSIECSPRNVPALVDTDCIRSRVDTPFKCTVTLGDRFNNVVGVSTTVKYQSEAGIVGTPPTTPMFPSPDLGKATGTIGTVGGVLPLDVVPMTGEYSYAFEDRCHPNATSTHNPRDGIVSVIAMMAGEEGFVDKNGDGFYNQGEPFIDLPEPFVDSNDNGVQDAGEFFQDLNNDKIWNPANGDWDESTTLWTETRVVYTGEPYGYAAPNTNLQVISRFFLLNMPGGPVDPTPPVPRQQLMADQTTDFGLWFSDANFNVLAPTVKYSVDIGMGDPITASLAAIPPMRPAREEGFFFAQRYCDGSTPTSCGMICPPTPTTQQCLVKSAVTQFEYGVEGTVRIKASSSVKGPFGAVGTATLPNSLGAVSLSGDVK
jgi:hypothetical protein